MPSRIIQRAKQIKKMLKKPALNSSQLPKLGKREYIKLIFLSIFNHFKGFKFAPLPQTADSRVDNFCETVFSGGSYFEYDNVSSDIFTFGKSTSNESFCGSNLLRNDGNRSRNESAGYSLLSISDAIAFSTLKPTSPNYKLLKAKASSNILEQISGVKTEITENNPSELLLRTFDMTRGSARENDDEVSITGLVHNDTTTPVTLGKSVNECNELDASFSQNGWKPVEFSPILQSTQGGKSSFERKIARAQEPWAYNEEEDIPGLRLATQFCYEPSLSSIFGMEKMFCFQEMDTETMLPTLNRYLPDTPVQSPLAQEPWAYNEEEDIPGLRLATQFCYEPSLSSIFGMEKMFCFQEMDTETMLPTLNRYLPDTPVQSPLPFSSGDYMSLLESEALVGTSPLEALSHQVMKPKEFKLRQSRGSCTINTTRVWQDSDSEDDDLFDVEHNSCDSDNSVLIDNSKHQPLLFSNIKTIFDDFYMPLVEL